jgi:hypothetical protein
MKKLLFLSLLFISISASAQFKLGGTVSAGFGSQSTAAPLDSFKFVGSAGIMGEITTHPVFFRTGFVFQGDGRQFIPLTLLFRASGTGAFLGGGVSLAMGGKESMYELIIGNKVSRNGDFYISFSHPLKGGTIQDCILAIHFTYYPLTTCGNSCEF